MQGLPADDGQIPKDYEGVGQGLERPTARDQERSTDDARRRQAFEQQTVSELEITGEVESLWKGPQRA